MWADGTFILLQVSGSVWGDNDDHCLGAPANGVATGWAAGCCSDHPGQTGIPRMMAQHGSVSPTLLPPQSQKC